jgi:hypothetical protein
MTHYRTAAGAYLGAFVGVAPPEGAIECPPPRDARAVWTGQGWADPPPPPVTDTPLTAAQWGYALDWFELRAPIEGFAAQLEPVARREALVFRARALAGRSFAFGDVLALIAAYRDAPGFPAALDLTEAQLAAMWAAVLADMPGEG